MKPFENWNPKSLMLAGAALGAGVLLLLAAVPSQTDFDGAYFKTNSLPISLTGYLTNWAKLDTNASGGDTIWATNADGVISPLGGQLTNVLRFTSGLADNATNIAFTVGTTTAWTDPLAKLAVVSNGGTNRAYIGPTGALVIGNNPGLDWSLDLNDAIIVSRDQTAGDPRGLNFGLQTFDAPVGSVSSAYLELFMDLSYYEMNFGAVKGAGHKMEWNFYTEGTGDTTYFDLQASHTNSLVSLPFVIKPSQSTDPNYVLGTSVAVTSGHLLESNNGGTNKFSVFFDGSITTGGNTNRWIFASYDNSKANVTVEGNAHALLSDETPVVNGNLGAALSVGDTTFVNMLKASQTNSIASAMTFSYATNGLDLIEFTHVRTFLNGSGSDQTVNLPSGWHKGQGAGSSFVVTNATLAKLYVTCMGPTSSAALQTNVTATVSFFP